MGIHGGSIERVVWIELGRTDEERSVGGGDDDNCDVGMRDKRGGVEGMAIQPESLRKGMEASIRHSTLGVGAAMDG